MIEVGSSDYVRGCLAHYSFEGWSNLQIEPEFIVLDGAAVVENECNLSKGEDWVYFTVFDKELNHFVDLDSVITKEFELKV